MARRFGLLIIALVTLLVAPVLMIGLGPVSVKADIGSASWLGAVYKGYDSLLGTYVQAFEVGSTATLMIGMRNDEENPLEIKRVKVEFDWDGGLYEAQPGDYPALLNPGKSGTAKISFTVPSEDVASNLVTHHYSVSVDCTGGYEYGGQVTGMRLGTGDGSKREFELAHAWVDPAAVKVYVNGVVTGDYSLVLCGLDYWCRARIVFNTPPADGSSIVADYLVMAYEEQGNGYTTEFQMRFYPIIPGTEVVYVGDVRCTDYTLDYDTGRIRFTNPPLYGEPVFASYDYYIRWFYGGDDFAVYTSEQVAPIDDGDPGHPEPTGNSWRGIGVAVLAGVGLAVLGVILYVVLRGKRPGSV